MTMYLCNKKHYGYLMDQVWGYLITLNFRLPLISVPWNFRPLILGTNIIHFTISSFPLSNKIQNTQIFTLFISLHLDLDG